MKKKNIIGPHFPDGKAQHKFIFVIDSNESFMIKCSENHNNNNKKLMEFQYRDFTLSNLTLTRPKDFLILNKIYKKYPTYLNHIITQYKSLKLDITENILYSEPFKFIDHANKLDVGDCIITPYFSYIETKEDSRLQISEFLNKKSNLRTHSEKGNFRIPKSFTFEEIKNLDFSKKYVLKADGVGNGENVYFIDSEDSLNEILETVNDEYIVQEFIPDKKLEINVDFRISSDRTSRLSYYFPIIDEEGSWFASFYKPNIEQQIENSLSEALKVAEYARTKGYSSSESLHFGVDLFLIENKTYISEINARYTGTVPHYSLIKRLELEDKESLFIFDEIGADKLDSFLEFIKKRKDGYFYIVLGINPESSQKYHSIIFTIIGDINRWIQDINDSPYKNSFKSLKEVIKNYKSILKKIKRLS